MEPSETSEGAPAAPPAPARELERTETDDVRLGALSLPSRLIISTAVGALGVYALYHMALVFLFVAPENTLNEDYGEGMREYVYPEFEQSWKLFAPNPLQRNVAVEVRAELREDDGGRRTTEWISLTDMDIERIEHDLFPSHTAQNELRRAWDFYSGAHTTEGEPVGLRGEVSGIYVHRIALLRLDDRLDLDDVERIQLRSATTLLPAPEWAPEEIDTTTSYQELSWWTVTSEDLPSGALASGDGDDEDNGEGEQP